MSDAQAEYDARLPTRLIDQAGFCGCGSPEMATRSLWALLQAVQDGTVDAIVEEKGLQMIVLYWLDHFELVEHGGSVGGCWLTEKGRAWLAELSQLSDAEILAVWDAP